MHVVQCSEHANHDVGYPQFYLLIPTTASDKGGKKLTLKQQFGYVGFKKDSTPPLRTNKAEPSFRNLTPPCQSRYFFLLTSIGEGVQTFSLTLPLDWSQVPHIPTSSKNGRAYKVKKSLYYSNCTRELCSLNLQKPVLIYWNLYHDVWEDKIIYSPYTLAQPFIFLCTLGCMVARTTNASAVANGPPTVWETLAN